VRDLALGARRHLVRTVGIDERHVVRVDREARAGLADIVRHDQVDALGRELLLRVRDHVVGLGREAHEHGTAALARPAELRE